jgi:hypothetical protein
MSNYYKVREMTLFLSTIIIFCIVPVVNAKNGHTNIKFITESTLYTGGAFDTEEILSGFGVDFYKNFNPESKILIYKGKSSYENKLEKMIERRQKQLKETNTKSTKNVEEQKKDLKVLKKRLKEERKKGGQVIPKQNESIGLIFEMKYLGGYLTNSVNSDVSNVQKSSFGIGIRIDW